MRWLLLFALITVGIGLYLRGGFSLSYLDWAGRLPGDLILRKGGVEIYFPFATSLLATFMLWLCASVLQKRSGA